VIGAGAVRTDGYDRRVFSQLYKTAKALRETAERIPLPEPERLMLDTWAGLYKPAPVFRDDISPDLLANRQLLEQAMKIPEWESLRDSSVLDEWAAALGAVVMGEKYPGLIPEEAKRQMEKAQKMQKEAQKFSAMADALEMQQDAGDAGTESQKQQSYRQQAGEMQKKAEQLARDAAGKINKRRIREAVKEAAEEVEDIQEKVLSFSWGTGPGRQTYVEGKERFELAFQLRDNPGLKKIAELAGRMRRIALAKQRSRVKHAPSEIYDVETGADLSRLLPVELVGLKSPARKKDFYRRFSEGKLLQYRLRGRETEGRGPVVVCLDSSGSMEGESEAWSKAVMLALFSTAARQKRAFACIHFGYKSEIKVFEYADPRRANPSEIAEMAAFFFNGGTDFEAPLNAALEIVKKSAFTKADIIFITDGFCEVSQEFLDIFLKEKGKKEFSVISVLMPGGNESSVRPFSDCTASVVPGEREDEALDLVFSI